MAQRRKYDMHRSTLHDLLVGFAIFLTSQRRTTLARKIRRLTIGSFITAAPRRTISMAGRP